MSGNRTTENHNLFYVRTSCSFLYNLQHVLLLRWKNVLLVIVAFLRYFFPTVHIIQNKTLLKYNNTSQLCSTLLIKFNNAFHLILFCNFPFILAHRIFQCNSPDCCNLIISSCNIIPDYFLLAGASNTIMFPMLPVYFTGSYRKLSIHPNLPFHATGNGK